MTRQYTLRPPRRPLSETVATARPFAAGELPAAFDPRASYPVPISQFGGACECYAYGRGLWIAGGMKGEEPSHVALYRMARMRERHYATEAIPDNGVNDFDVLGAITLTGDAANDANVWGLVPGSVWPDSQEAIDAELPFDVLQAAVPITPDCVALVPGFGADRIAAVKAHAFARQPVAFTMPVDRSYEYWGDATAYRGPSGPSVGNHKQLAVGHRPSTTGSALDDILVMGSWGQGVADSGYFWLAGDFFASLAVTDVVACLGGAW